VGAGFSRDGRAESPPPHVMLEIFTHRSVGHKALELLFPKELRKSVHPYTRHARPSGLTDHDSFVRVR
jgi:hypothetical protein